jgi:hypothetical protein
LDPQFTGHLGIQDDLILGRKTGEENKGPLTAQELNRALGTLSACGVVVLKGVYGSELTSKLLRAMKAVAGE